jgi:hypothetical protein
MATTEAAPDTPTRRPAAFMALIVPLSFVQPFCAAAGDGGALTLAASVRAYYRR